MNRKRILRSWWLWAAVILFGFLVLPNLLSERQQLPRRRHLRGRSRQIQAGNVTKATQEDKEQTLQLDLKTPVDGNTTRSARSTRPTPSTTIFNDLVAAQDKNRAADFNIKVTQGATPGCPCWSACCRSC